MVRSATLAERASFRSIVFPPRFPEPLGDATTRRHTQIKVFFVLSSILLDVLIWLLLRNQSTIHQPALRFFFVFNVAALSLDVIVNALALRFARTTRAWRAAFAYSAGRVAACDHRSGA